jgi:putative N6-adenine-specific DNA methylase
MSFSNELSVIVVSCASGVAPYLEQEVVALGLPVTWRGETAVETQGSLDDTMRLNLHLRTGHRVFYMLGEFRARDPDELYERLVRLPWEDYIAPTGYFTVDTSVDTPTIRNEQFAALRVKDAVADRMRERCGGQRPDSGNEQEGVALFLHWTGQDAAIYLNTSGGALSKRGYRVAASSAPMRESLAAAVVMASGWTGEGHFLNPMCGGGTLAIEAAWIGLHRAPGLLRSDFSFMHLTGFETSTWRLLRQQAIAAIKPGLDVRIIASDVDAAALRAARANAEAAGALGHIEFDACDVTLSPVPDPVPGSVIVINPPYGARMGEAAKLRSTYADIGGFLRKQAPGYRGYVFTANPDLAERVGLQTRQSIPFFNGPLEARLLEYGGYDPARRNHASGFPDDAAATGS